jgi:DNA invertase Pin-like site-specific DNA recombinase
VWRTWWKRKLRFWDFVVQKLGMPQAPGPPSAGPASWILTILDLEGLGIRFHSLKEPMLDTPEDGQPNLGRDVLLALLPVIASFESKRRSERVRVAMREIKEGRRRTRSGRPPGRPVRATPEKVSAIVRLKAQGLTWKVIAQRVGLPRGTCANVASRVRRGLLENSLDTKGSDRPSTDPAPT